MRGEKSGCANEQCLDRVGVMGSFANANAVSEKNTQTLLTFVRNFDSSIRFLKVFIVVGVSVVG